MFSDTDEQPRSWNTRAYNFDLLMNDLLFTIAARGQLDPDLQAEIISCRASGGMSIPHLREEYRPIVMQGLLATAQAVIQIDLTGDARWRKLDWASYQDDLRELVGQVDEELK
jgi:hypothetical protein